MITPSKVEAASAAAARAAGDDEKDCWNSVQVFCNPSSLSYSMEAAPILQVDQGKAFAR